MTPTPIIRIRNVPALAGLRWIRLALRAFARQPAGFMGMFGLYLLAVLVLSIPLSLLVPLAEALHLDPTVAGSLNLAAMPLLSLAFMLATQSVTNDLRIRPGLLVAPLQGSPQGRRSLAVVGLAYYAVFMLAWFVGNAIDGGEHVRWFTDHAIAPPDGKGPPTLTPLSDAARAAVLVKTAIVALGSIPLWHAPPLIHWGRYGAAKAMFASVVALWRTRAALTVFALGWFALLLGIATVLTVLALVFASSVLFLAFGLALLWAFSALFYVTLWFGFVDTFEISSPVPFRTVIASEDPPAP